MKIIKPSFELLDAVDGASVLRKIEQCGRTCYKSEDRITPDSAEKFVRGILKSGHESVIEHVSITGRFICDRGVTHEIVRHRIASYSQESTRYCVAGDTALKTSNAHNRLTVSELYENAKKSRNGAWKRMRFKQFNEEKGVLQYAHVKNVFKVGDKECVTVRTKLGYEITCTPDHKIYTPSGYVEAAFLKVGGQVYVNGTAELYMNREWLYFQSIILNKTFSKIAEDFGFNVSTIKKWARKLGIPKKGTGYFNIGHIPWNKGKQDARQIEALRKYHHCGRRKDRIIKDDTVKYQRHKGCRCAVCGTDESLEVHHVDKDRTNNKSNNLITLCESCHMRVHSQNLLTAYADKIVEVKDAGVQTVYDIEMDSEYHNFVANGVIVHNCNYSSGKFGSEITVIEPCFFSRKSLLYAEWEHACQNAEAEYNSLIAFGATPEQARSVLPNSLKTELVMTANLREWRHFFRLRCSERAHPQMREVSAMALKTMHEAIPVVFDDLWEVYGNGN